MGDLLDLDAGSPTAAAPAQRVRLGQYLADSCAPSPCLAQLHCARLFFFPCIPTPNNTASLLLSLNQSIRLPHTPSLHPKPYPTETSPLSATTTNSHLITHQGIDDLLGGLDLGPSQPTGPPPPLPVVLADTARGVTVGARLIRHQNSIGYHISITNSSQGGWEGGVSQAVSQASRVLFRVCFRTVSV